MPTTTFFHLSLEKQARILQAAIKEFAEYRFSDASINRIIKTAGIPRGSFYQYFADKEDIYLHVLQQISKEKLDIFTHYAGEEREASFFELLNQILPAIFAWADRQAEYNLIGLRMAQDDSEFIHNTISKMHSSFDALEELICHEQDKGLIRRDLDPALVGELLQMIAVPLLKSYYQTEDKAQVAAKIHDFYTMIFYGLAAKMERRGEGQ